MNENEQSGEDAKARTPEASSPAPSLWRDGNFMRFWGGMALADLSHSLGSIVLPIVAVAYLSATEADLGLLNFASTLGFLIVGLPAGAIIDRMVKRRVMIAADIVRVIAMAVLPLLWLAGGLAFWHLVVVSTVVGVATVFFDVSYQSHIPNLVRPDQIADANSRLEATGQVARLIGPTLGGVLVSLLRAPLLFALDALGYAASLCALIFTRTDEVRTERHEHPPLVQSIREGLAYVAHQPLIRAFVITTALSNLGGVMLSTLEPIIVLRVLGLEPWVVGLMGSAAGVGGLVAASLTTRIARRIGDGPTTLLGIALSVIGMAGVPLATLVEGSAGQIAVLLGGTLLLGFGIVAYNVLQVSMRQRITPKRLLGRMNASVRFVVWGIMPIGALLAGALGTALPTALAGAIGVGISALGALTLAFSPVRHTRRLPDAPNEDATA